MRGTIVFANKTARRYVLRHERPSEDGSYMMLEQGVGNSLELGDVVEFGAQRDVRNRIYCEKRGASNVHVHKVYCDFSEAVSWAKEVFPR